MPGMMGQMPGERGPADQPDGTALATLRVAGEPVPQLPTVPIQDVPEDLRSAAVAARRRIVLAAGMGRGMMRFTINGKEFQEARIDTRVASGSVEEWTLTNASPMDHPFHLHVWPMQIIEENGQSVDDAIWQDVVNVPANGRVKVRVAFKDFRGRSVYHCHILDHEDLGMMGSIEVT